MDFIQQPGMSLLPLDIDAPDFDYGAFLQEDDMDYLAEDRSQSNPSVMASATAVEPVLQGAITTDPSSSSTVSLTPTSPGTSSGTSPPKNRLERRGHTKSRRGCFNCKRRRIKCQETRPACGHCVKTGLKCEYPAIPQVVHQPQHQIPLFSLQDMRLFQHFLLVCYPHQPIGNGSIWTHEIPCLSQNYEYLMHAVLGLAATELMGQDPSLVTAAMSHRLKAIKAVKKTLSDIPGQSNFYEEGNALMATCYALTFQSVGLDDGMAEFMTFIRGIVIVAIHMYIKGAKFLFRNFAGEDQMDLLKPVMEKLPLIENSWTDAAAKAIQALAPLCQDDDTALAYHKLLVEIAEKLYVSSWEAYRALSKHYGWWMQISHEKFRAVVDPENQIFLLLASHWIAIKQIMAAITETEVFVSKGDQVHEGHSKDTPLNKSDSRDRGMDMGILKWLRYLNGQIRPEYQSYNRWPVWVQAQIESDPYCFGRTVH